MANKQQEQLQSKLRKTDWATSLSMTFCGYSSMPDQAAEDVREFYLMLMRGLDSKYFEMLREKGSRSVGLGSMKGLQQELEQQLMLPLKTALENTGRGQRLFEGRSQPVHVVVGQDGKLQRCDEKVLMVGLRPFCNIQLDLGSQQRAGVSRAHCFLINFPGGILVVDAWSLGGTKIRHREDGQEELYISRPGRRQIFSVPHHEAVILQMGCQIVMLNPKVCLACSERPITVRLECGHRALCAKCHRNPACAECPLCRAPADGCQQHACIAAQHTYAPF